jgi:hypothetical protein
MDKQPPGILRPDHVRPSGDRQKTLWLIGMALAESLGKPRAEDTAAWPVWGKTGPSGDTRGRQ